MDDEALTKVGNGALSHQFSHRAAALAFAVGFSLTYEQAKELFNERSIEVHAVDPVQPVGRDPFGLLFVEVCETLRAAVHRALEDHAFAATFETDAAVEHHWPLPGEDRLVRGLRRVLRSHGTDRFAGDAMSWTGDLVKKTGADMETGVRVAKALTAVGPDPRPERRRPPR